MGCCRSHPETPTVALVHFQTQLRGITLTVALGDITNEPVDVIVNSANVNLHHAGGVAGAIVRKGGVEIQNESNAIVRESGPLEFGTIAVTTAGSMRFRHIIHAVGPLYEDGKQGEAQLLGSLIEKVLEKAEEMRVRSVSFPAISTGICGFPKSKCAEIFLESICTHVEKSGMSCLREIRVVSIDPSTVSRIQTEVFAQRFRERFESNY